MPSIPTPFDVPFDLCFPRPDNDRWVCVKSTDIFPGKTYECGSTTTPPLVSVDMTFIEKTISFFDDNAGVTGEVSGWIGVEEDLSCVWFGVNEGDTGECGKICKPKFSEVVSAPAHDIADEISDTAWDVTHWFSDRISFLSRGGAGERIVYSMVLVVVVVVFIAAAGTGTAG